MKKEVARDKAFKVLWWQFAEMQKALGSDVSIQECFLFVEIMKMYGTAEAYNGNFKCSKNYSSTARHIHSLQEKGLITYERKFRSSKTQYVDLTEKGEYVMARLIRLSKGEMA